MSIEKFIENFDELTKEFSKDTSLVFEKVDSANNTKFRVCYVTPKVPCKMFLCLKYTTKYSSIDVVREVIKNFKNKNDELVNSSRYIIEAEMLDKTFRYTLTGRKPTFRGDVLIYSKSKTNATNFVYIKNYLGVSVREI